MKKYMRHPPQSTFEVALTSKAKSPAITEILKNVFNTAGIPMERLIEYQERSLVGVLTYLSSHQKAASLRKKLTGFRLKNVKIQSRRLQPKDWQGKWKLDLEPFVLSKKFDVVPVWKRNSYRPSRREPILIDTITAFGTGQHETTRFMVYLIEQCEGQFKTFLDVGTGTGILSIAALKCGAEDVGAIDINEDSVKVAEKNISANGYRYASLQTADLKTFHPGQKFDFVAANLITDRLLKMKNKLVSLVRPGGFLAVSGISLENLRILRECYQKLPLRCVRVKKGKDWAAILYKRIV